MLTGDGELQEGQFWESLGSAVTRGLGEITAIIDHNKIQSDTWVHEVSPLGDLGDKLRAFGWHVARCDGHDVDALERVFREFDARDRPAQGADRRHDQGPRRRASWKGPPR